MPTFGTCQRAVTWPPVWLPIKNTRSASPTALFADVREYVPTTPTDNGLVSRMAPLPLSEVATGIDNFSANATTSAWARDHTTPPPATMIGRSAASSNLIAASTCTGSPDGRNGGNSL